MATHTTIKLVDDIDGTEAIETIEFSIDGRTFEIDLSEANAGRLRDVFAPFVSAGRRAGGSGARSSSRKPGRPSLTVVRNGAAPAASRAGDKRRWAFEHGLITEAQANGRGRLPGAVDVAWERYLSGSQTALNVQPDAEATESTPAVETDAPAPVEAPAVKAPAPAAKPRKRKAASEAPTEAPAEPQTIAATRVRLTGKLQQLAIEELGFALVVRPTYAIIAGDREQVAATIQTAMDGCEDKTESPYKALIAVRNRVQAPTKANDVESVVHTLDAPKAESA